MNARAWRAHNDCARSTPFPWTLAIWCERPGTHAGVRVDNTGSVPAGRGSVVRRLSHEIARHRAVASRPARARPSHREHRFQLHGYPHARERKQTPGQRQAGHPQFIFRVDCSGIGHMMTGRQLTRGSSANWSRIQHEKNARTARAHCCRRCLSSLLTTR